VLAGGVGSFHSSSMSHSQYSASAACLSSRSSSALSVAAAHVSSSFEGVLCMPLFLAERAAQRHTTDLN